MRHDDPAFPTRDAAIEPSELKPLTVTIATARRITGLGNTTIWALIKDKKLETVHVGRRTLVTYRSLEALLAPTAKPESQDRSCGAK